MENFAAAMEHYVTGENPLNREEYLHRVTRHGAWETGVWETGDSVG